MKLITVLGIVFVALGIVSFIYRGITYTKEEHQINLGPIHATAEKKETIPIHPVIGGVLLVGGIVMVAAGVRKG